MDCVLLQNLECLPKGHFDALGNTVSHDVTAVIKHRIILCQAMITMMICFLKIQY